MANVFENHMCIIHHRLDKSGLHGIIKTDIDRMDFLRSVNEANNPDVSEKVSLNCEIYHLILWYLTSQRLFKESEKQFVLCQEAITVVMLSIFSNLLAAVKVISLFKCYKDKYP